MNGRAWSPAEIRKLRKLYPNTRAKKIAKRLKHSLSSVYQTATRHRIKKTREALAANARPLMRAGAKYRFKKGLIPWNTGMKGWRSGGRSAEHYFAKGHVSANRQEVGALRINADGYIDMKIKEGLRAWAEFHVILWEDTHGPVPKGHCLVFRDHDRLNICDENIELISRGDLMRRNSIHNLPAPLASTIQLLGQLKRRIREKQDGRSAQPPVRDARSAAG
jgi:hypothetical protein